MMPWGPKQETPDRAALEAALVQEQAAETESSPENMQEALRTALEEAEVARKAASVRYQQSVIDENEKKNG